MKACETVAVLATALSILCTPVLANPAQLDWMLGCWTTPDGSAREVWVRQSDQQLNGFSITLQDGNIVFHEVLNIDFDEDGIHYTAHPQGQSATTFSAPDAAGLQVAFQNAEHDYPQVVSYQLDDEWLRATISLLDGSKANSFDKVRCPD